MNKRQIKKAAAKALTKGYYCGPAYFSHKLEKVVKEGRVWVAVYAPKVEGSQYENLSFNRRGRIVD